VRLRRPLLSALLSMAAASAMVVMSACRHKERTPVERGFGVFMRSCAGCHGPDARGTRPPGFSVPPRDLTDPELQAHLSDDAIRDTIRHGKGQMPPFGAALSETDVSDVIQYVRSLNRAKGR
jgi:mono/diheme cytochrome c family protein